MPLINCKIELKLKWTKYCVLPANDYDNDNDNDNANNIIFTIKDTKLYVPVVTFLVRDNQNLSKLLSKGFGRLVYWKEYKTKSENKNTSNEYRYFFKLNFVEVNSLFSLVYLNQDGISKRFKAKKYYLPKGIMDNYSVIINRNNFYDQTIGSDIKRYEEIRKLTTGQCED